MKACVDVCTDLHNIYTQMSMYMHMGNACVYIYDMYRVFVLSLGYIPKYVCLWVTPGRQKKERKELLINNDGKKERRKLWPKDTFAPA